MAAQHLAQHEEQGFRCLDLDGSTPAEERERRVDAFQTGAYDAFLMSLRAGGTGLNLTAADYVLHLDPWWNPAVEDQATDPAHRIGQERPVTVYRLVSRGTIEETIVKPHTEKRQLVEGVLEGTGAVGLSVDDLKELLAEGGRWRVPMLFFLHAVPDACTPPLRCSRAPILPVGRRDDARRAARDAAFR